MRFFIPQARLSLPLFSLAAFAALLLFASGCLEGDTTLSGPLKKYDAAVMASVNGVIDAEMAAANAPGAIVAIWEDGYETRIITKGAADIVSGRPPAAADRFRAASNTKMFTAMALLILADRKRIGLDDRVSKYIDDIPYADQITIRQLASHSSGYYDYSADPAFTAAAGANLFRRWKPRELLEYIKGKPLNFAPGTSYKYSNTNYVIMGMIVETVSGMSWEDFVTLNILRPLVMADTECPLGHAISGSYLKGYNIDEGATVEVIVDPSWGWAAGSMISNVFDLKKWLDALAGHSLISPAMFAEQMKCVPDPESGGTMEYGFGVMRVWNQFIGHTGVIMGYNSATLISLDGKKAVVAVFNNEQGFHAATAAFKLTKMLFKK